MKAFSFGESFFIDPRIVFMSNLLKKERKSPSKLAVSEAEK